MFLSEAAREPHDSLEYYLQRKLNDPRAARRTVRAEVGIDLLARGVESRGCKKPGELRVVPGVEQLRSELQETGFGIQRNPFAHVDVPIVDAGAAKDVHARVAEIAQARAREGVDVEIAIEGAL